MKKIVFALLLVACSNADVAHDGALPTPSSPALPDKPSPPKREAEPTRFCEDVVRVDRTSECVIYTFLCDDGETEYYLTCSTRPIGVVTNPPRPIDEEAADHPGPR